MAASLADWDVEVGEVLAPCGLKGEVKVRPSTDFADRFAAGNVVCVRSSQGREQLLTLAACRRYKGSVYLYFEGIRDRKQAEWLRRCRLCITREMCAPLPEGHYYQFDIIGMDVEDEAGKSLGRIAEVLRTGSNDVYVTPQALIPATKEAVLEIDLERKRMRVRLSVAMLRGGATQAVEG